MIETWLPVIDYEGLYEVSDYGRVQSLDRWVPDGRNGRNLKGRILTPGPCIGGKYLSVNLSKNGVQHTVLVQYLVLESHVGPRPPGLEACHRDDDGHNNWLYNLRWDTRKSNISDREKNGNPHHNSLKTQCAQGHDYSPDNTRILPNGNRRCRKCQQKWRLAK